jgi:hypothetical protein
MDVGGVAVGEEANVRAADRLALRDLVETYARGADRREPELVASLFGETGVLSRADAPGEPGWVRNGAAEIEGPMRRLSRYDVTTHFLGQQSVWFDAADADRATGETYCLAHHLHVVDGLQVNDVMSIRYQDEYVRASGRWRFATRTLVVDWTERRPTGR